MSSASWRDALAATDFGPGASVHFRVPSPMPRGVPESWAGFVGATSDAAIKSWMPFADRLPRTLRQMSRRLQGVALLLTPSEPQLLYCFRAWDGLLTFAGGPPANAPKSALPLPDDFLDFLRLHDGWTIQDTGAHGVLGSRRWHSVASVASDAVEEDRRIGLDTNRLTVVSTYGPDTRVAFDLAAPSPRCVLWSPQFTPHFTADHWMTLDDVTASLLAEADPAEDAKGPAESFWFGAWRKHATRVTQAADTIRANGDVGPLTDLALAEVALAVLDARERRAPERVTQALHAALDDFMLAMEADRGLQIENAASWLWCAIAAGHAPAVHSIVARRPGLWPERDPGAAAAICAGALYRGEPGRAAALLDLLRGLESDEAPEPRVPAHGRLAAALDAVEKGDARALTARLEERLAVDVEDPDSLFSAEPLSLVDFPALALCRLARARGLRVDIAHARLPREVR